MITRNLVRGALTAAFIGLSSVAGAQHFDSPTVTANGTVSATADFSISGGNLTIVLTNTLLNQVSSGQAISDLHWTINGGSFTTLASDTTPLAAGNYITIHDGGTSTFAGINLDSWGLSNTAGTYNLTTLTGGQPKGLIWGNGVASANNGADNFNPYVDQTATFTLAIAGLLDSAVISDVVFTFGTNGAVAVVPIPAAIWLFGSGLVGLIGIARRRQLGIAAAPALAA